MLERYCVAPQKSAWPQPLVPTSASGFNQGSQTDAALQDWAGSVSGRHFWNEGPQCLVSTKYRCAILSLMTWFVMVCGTMVHGTMIHTRLQILLPILMCEGVQVIVQHTHSLFISWNSTIAWSLNSPVTSRRNCRDLNSVFFSVLPVLSNHYITNRASLCYILDAKLAQSFQGISGHWDGFSEYLLLSKHLAQNAFL